MNLRDYIRNIPDFPRKGILFRDITPLLLNPDAFDWAISEMVGIAKDLKPDVIIGIESRGFIFAIPISMNLGLPFVPVRKKGKLPYKTISEEYSLEYGKDKIEVHSDAIKKNENVLLVDDLIATGGTADASAKLIKISNGKVAGFIFVINLFDLGGCDKLINQGYKVENLINFPGH